MAQLSEEQQERELPPLSPEEAIQRLAHVLKLLESIDSHESPLPKARVLLRGVIGCGIATSLLDSDSQAAELPEWTDCQSAFADGTATPLTEFIRAYEPVESTQSDDTVAQEWRTVLSRVINDATTAMRDKCVDTIKSLWLPLLSKSHQHE